MRPREGGVAGCGTWRPNWLPEGVPPIKASVLILRDQDSIGNLDCLKPEGEGTK